MTFWEWWRTVFFFGVLWVAGFYIGWQIGDFLKMVLPGPVVPLMAAFLLLVTLVAWVIHRIHNGPDLV